VAVAGTAGGLAAAGTFSPKFFELAEENLGKSRA
jgi:hypothetical protein